MNPVLAWIGWHVGIMAMTLAASEPVPDYD